MSQKDIFPLCPLDDLYTAISSASLGYKSSVTRKQEYIGLVTDLIKM